MADEPEPAEGELTFQFERAHDYREANVDGGLGAPTPTGDKIFLALYSERASLPSSIRNRVGPRGVLAEEITDSREAPVIVRYIHTGLYLDEATARQIASWLNERADDLGAAARLRSRLIAEIDAEKRSNDSANAS